jgi:hypothetical protein
MQKKHLILVLVVLILVAGGVLVWSKKVSQEVSRGEVKNIDTGTDMVGTSDWKTYRNEQIGIQFDYPSFWGNIILSKEVGCVDYYAEKVVIPENVKDSCLHITLSAGNLDHGAFLSTEGIDYTNTEIPREADWRYKILAFQKEKEDFCSNNPFISSDNKGGSLRDCESFKNNKGLVVTKGIRETTFSDNEFMTVYFIRTNHPIYYDVVVSPQYLLGKSPTVENDIRKLVETIQPL